MKNHPKIVNKGRKGTPGVLEMTGRINKKMADAFLHRKAHNRMVGIK